MGIIRRLLRRLRPRTKRRARDGTVTGASADAVVRRGDGDEAAARLRGARNTLASAERARKQAAIALERQASDGAAGRYVRASADWGQAKKRVEALEREASD